MFSRAASVEVRFVAANPLLKAVWDKKIHQNGKYKAPLPFRRCLTTEGNRDLLLKLYEETAANWRQLTEVRFHLLALVPAVSILLVDHSPLRGRACQRTLGARQSCHCCIRFSDNPRAVNLRSS